MPGLADGGLISTGAKRLCRIKGTAKNHPQTAQKLRWAQCPMHISPNFGWPVRSKNRKLFFQSALRWCLISLCLGQRGDLRACRRASLIQAGSPWSSDWDVLTLLTKPIWQSLHKVQPLGLTDHFSPHHLFVESLLTCLDWKSGNTTSASPLQWF